MATLQERDVMRELKPLRNLREAECSGKSSFHHRKSSTDRLDRRADAGSVVHHEGGKENGTSTSVETREPISL